MLIYVQIGCTIGPPKGPVVTGFYRSFYSFEMKSPRPRPSETGEGPVLAVQSGPAFSLLSVLGLDF
jgi:hypothetical protein